MVTCCLLFFPSGGSWLNTFFSRVLSHLGNGRLSFLPTNTAGPVLWFANAWGATTRRAVLLDSFSLLVVCWGDFACGRGTVVARQKYPKTGLETCGF